MRVIELKVERFGRLSKKTIRLSPGINVIYGENEAGKTTLYTFMKAMLFDIERKRGRAARGDEFTRYEPWGDYSHFGGSLRFHTGGKTFVVRRSFQKNVRNSELYCEDDGESLNADNGDLESLLGGVDALNFENTVCIGQGKVETSDQLKEQLKNYAASYYDTGNDEVVIREIVEDLKKKKKKSDMEFQEYKEEKEVKIQKIEAQREFVENEMEKLERKCDELNEECFEEESKRLTKTSRILLAVGIGIAAVLSGIFLKRPLNYLVVTTWLGIAIFVGRKEWEKHRLYARQYKEVQKQSWEIERTKVQLQEKRVVVDNLQEWLTEVCLPTEIDFEYVRDTASIQLAIEKVIESAAAIQKEFGDRLNTIASETITFLTSGSYSRLFIDENLQVTVKMGDRRVSLNQLSRGTVEQVYFSLRIAVADVMQEEKLPIILDDAFGHYDNKRLKRLFQWLEVSERQVIILSCQEREEKLLGELGISYSMIRM